MSTTAVGEAPPTDAQMQREYRRRAAERAEALPKMLLNKHDVAAVLRVGTTTVDRLRNGERNRRNRKTGEAAPDIEPDPLFPAPVKFGRRTLWRVDDIQRYVDGLPPVDRSAT